MSCCRRGRPMKRQKPQSEAHCVNCYRSLREDVKRMIASHAAKASLTGTYSVTLTIPCEACKWENKVPATYSKH